MADMENFYDDLIIINLYGTHIPLYKELHNCAVWYKFCNLKQKLVVWIYFWISCFYQSQQK